MKSRIKLTDGSFLRSRTFVGAMCIAAAVILFIANSFMPIFLGRVTDVVVMTEAVEKGGIITEKDIQIKKTLSSTFAASVPLSDAAQAVGRYAVSDLYPGDVLTPSRISVTPPYSDAALYSLEEGCLAFSIAIDSLEQGLADKLISGDVVSVYAVPDGIYDSYTGSFSDPVCLYDELRYVEILSVSDAGGNEVDNSFRTLSDQRDQTHSRTAAVTLKVTPRQALLLANIQAKGHFHLALAGRGEACKGLLEIQKGLLAAADAQDAALPYTPEVGDE